jgi:hypothetical protein
VVGSWLAQFSPVQSSPLQFSSVQRLATVHGNISKIKSGTIDNGHTSLNSAFSFLISHFLRLWA